VNVGDAWEPGEGKIVSLNSIKKSRETLSVKEGGVQPPKLGKHGRLILLMELRQSEKVNYVVSKSIIG